MRRRISIRVVSVRPSPVIFRRVPGASCAVYPALFWILTRGKEVYESLEIVIVEDFQQGRHFPFHVLTFELVFIDVQIRDHA